MSATHAIQVLLAAGDDVADPAGAVAAARAIADLPVIATIVAKAEPAALLEAIAQEGPAAIHLHLSDALADPADGSQLVAAFASLVETSAAATLCVLPAGPFGEELAARLAARCGGTALGKAARITPAEPGFSVARPGYGGRARLVFTVPQGPCFVALRRPESALRPQAASPIITRRHLDLALPAPAERHWRPSEAPLAPLAGARVVVAGGRGMTGPEGFRLLQELAETLGGALGGSLPAVDAGWVPVSQQVGQSGHHVRPEIYLAFGISGTPQHMAGLGAATRIFAINRDPEAPIFEVAELGIVGEWQTIAPALLQALRAP